MRNPLSVAAAAAVVMGVAGAALGEVGLIRPGFGAIALALGCSSPALAYLMHHALRLQGWGARLLVVLIGAAPFIASGIPALARVAPGRAVFSGTLSAPGDGVSVPADARGAYWLLIAGTPPQSFTIQGPQPRLRAALSTRTYHDYVGPLTRIHVRAERGERYFRVMIPDGTPALRLERRSGSEAPLKLGAYRFLPPGTVALVTAFAMIAAAMVGRRFGLGTRLTVPASILGIFAFAVLAGATPGTSIALVALRVVPSAVLGGIVGWSLTGLVEVASRRLRRPTHEGGSGANVRTRRQRERRRLRKREKVRRSGRRRS